MSLDRIDPDFQHKPVMLGWKIFRYGSTVKQTVRGATWSIVDRNKLIGMIFAHSVYDINTEYTAVELPIATDQWPFSKYTSGFHFYRTRQTARDMIRMHRPAGIFIIRRVLMHDVHTLGYQEFSGSFAKPRRSYKALFTCYVAKRMTILPKRG